MKDQEGKKKEEEEKKNYGKNTHAHTQHAHIHTHITPKHMCGKISLQTYMHPQITW